MKKTLISSIFLLGLSMNQAFAQDSTSGFYVQGEAGYSSLRISDFDGSKRVPDQRISIGSYSSGGRIALDYTNFGNLAVSSSINGVKVDANVKVKSIGLSGIADFKTDSGFAPYLGVRVSLNYADYDLKAGNYLYNVKSTGQESSLGFGALGGVEYYVNPHFVLNLGVEYNRLSSDINQFGTKAGFRYNF